MDNSQKYHQHYRVLSSLGWGNKERNIGLRGRTNDDDATGHPAGVSLHVALLCIFSNQQRCIKGQVGCHGVYNQNSRRNTKAVHLGTKNNPHFSVSCDLVQMNNS